MEAEYRGVSDRWYHSARWQRLRTHQLQLQPLCVMCLKENILTAAKVVDHIEPHRGDVNKFWLGKLQSLCLQHHNKTKLQIETQGFASDIGPDGYPSDPQHPFNIASSRSIQCR